MTSIPTGGEPLTFGSLFSGVGGADLGLERAGMRCLWHCEWDRAASDVLRYQWPDLTNYGDVRTFPAEDVPCPDVLWMSPPCQDLSVAGKRAGLAGERSGLFYDAIDVVRRLYRRGLKWVLMEQVPGLFSANAGEDIRQALLAFLDFGVPVAWRVLDSQWFGVPQRRRRAYFVLDLGGDRGPEVLALAQGLRGDTAPSREKGQVAATLFASGAGTSRPAGCASEPDFLVADTLRNHPRPGSNTLGAVALAPALRAKANCSHRADMEAFVAHTLRADGFDASEDGTGRGTPIVPVIGLDADYNGNAELVNAMKANGQGAIRNGAVAFGWNKSESQTMRVDEATTDALQASSTSNPAVAFAQNQRGELRESGVSSQVTCGGGKPGEGYPAVRSGMAVRRLTPRECERLQGWPDDHSRYGRKEGGKVYEQADGPRYKQAGNGVTANVSEWIGRNLILANQGGI